jgi:acetolactate synthase-1/2/3 large subunit
VNGVDLTEVMLHLSETLPANSILTNGAGNYSVWLHRYYRYKSPRTELATTCGSMGYGLPAAVAAALRYKDRPVLCVAGDGCFMMYAQELATAVEYGATLIVLVVNNGMYGTIRMHQEKHYPGRVSGTRLKGPDYVGLAKAFGAYAEQVTDAADFPAAFERARSAGGVSLIELVTDPLQITPAQRLSAK